MHELGIDVSKAKLDCALILAGKPEKTLNKTMLNTPEGYEKILQWCCQKASCSPEELHVTLEATGPYHEQALLAFYQQGCPVSVVNPSRIKHFAQSEGLRVKNDPIDSRAIARFGLKMTPALWKPAPPEYHQLQALLNRLEAVMDDLQREENRWEKNTFMSDPAPSVTDSLARSIHFLKTEKKELEELIQHQVENHPTLKNDQELLCSIPGIGPRLASWMNALLKHGEPFQNARQAAAYLGLTPTECKSGSSVSKKSRISKMGPALYRKKLYMAALSAMTHNLDVKDLYQRLLKKGKKKMEALCAAMRKLVHLCFGVIKHQQKYKVQLQLKEATQS